MFLTQQGGFIVRPIAKLLGFILELIYNGLSRIGIINIGVAIILFTLVIKLCLTPMMIKSSKSSKVMNYIQPELNKIAKKYKGKRDQESLLAQQQETRKVQEKYGVSMTAGCLPALIQFPIIIALYNVIRNVPAYVDKIYNLYNPIATRIFENPDAIQKLEEFKNTENVLKAVTLDAANKDTIIDVLAKFQASTWDSFKELFGNQGVIVDAINQNVPEINKIYNFFGINLTSVPGFALTVALIIPIASLVFQFLSMHATPQQPASDPTQQATMKSMKMMMNVMPIMSFFVCVSVPAGVGLYWATGSFVSFLTAIIINAYFKNCDMEKVIAKSMEKAAKKQEKRAKKGKKSFMERMQEAAYGTQDAPAKVNSSAATASLKSYSSSTMKNSNGDVRYKQGSLAAKANVMQRYNDNNGGKN